MDANEIKYYTSIVLAVGLIAIIVFTFIVSTIINQKKIAQLHEESIKAEIDILEKERKRIAEDLHDDMGPILSTIKLYLGMLSDPPEEEKPIIEKVGGLLDNAIAEIRVISQNLLPVALQNRGLLQAIVELVGHINASGKTHIYLSTEMLSLHCGKEDEIAIFRIMHELLNNIIKHAKATEVHINMSLRNNVLRIQIKDNGIGFDYNSMRAKNTGNRGLGLRSITNRVKMLQGRVSFQSEAGKGTEVKLELPMQ